MLGVVSARLAYIRVIIVGVSIAVVVVGERERRVTRRLPRVGLCEAGPRMFLRRFALSGSLREDTYYDRSEA